MQGFPVCIVFLLRDQCKIGRCVLLALTSDEPEILPIHRTNFKYSICNSTKLIANRCQFNIHSFLILIHNDLKRRYLYQ